MQTSTRYTALIIGLVVLTLGLTACGPSANDLVNSGNAHLSGGEYELAIKDYDEAIRKDPEQAYIYVNRGLAYINIDGEMKAIQDFDVAIGLDPEFALAYLYRGDTYRALDMMERGREDWRKGIGHMLSSIEGASDDYRFSWAGLASRDSSVIKDSKDRELWEDYGEKRWIKMWTECFSYVRGDLC